MGAVTLSGAVIAQGSLVVESNVKRVQHPTGGVVGELMVHDGARVEAGDILLRLDPTETQANLAAVSKRLVGADRTPRTARGRARRGETVAFPRELEDAVDPEIARIVTGEAKLFELRREANADRSRNCASASRSCAKRSTVSTEQSGPKRRRLSSSSKELVGVRDLYEKNLVPINRVTVLERDAARLPGERGQLAAATAQARGKISEIELQIMQLDQNVRSDVAKELADIRAKMAELSERR